MVGYCERNADPDGTNDNLVAFGRKEVRFHHRNGHQDIFSIAIYFFFQRKPLGIFGNN